MARKSGRAQLVGPSGRSRGCPKQYEAYLDSDPAQIRRSERWETLAGQQKGGDEVVRSRRRQKNSLKSDLYDRSMLKRVLYQPIRGLEVVRKVRTWSVCAPWPSSPAQDPRLCGDRF